MINILSSLLDYGCSNAFGMEEQSLKGSIRNRVKLIKSMLYFPFGRFRRK